MSTQSITGVVYDATSASVGGPGLAHPLMPEGLHNIFLDSPLVSWVTNLADTGVVLPLSVLLIGMLWYLERGRSAWIFARALLICLVAMAVLKLIFLSCGQAIGANINSPSGHTSLAFFFYGTAATLFWARRPGFAGIVVGLLTLMLITLIGASRLLLHAHNLQEIIFGGAVGAVSLICFAVPYLRISHPALRLRRIAIILLPAFALTYGTILPAENILRAIAPIFYLGICTP